MNDDDDKADEIFDSSLDAARDDNNKEAVSITELEKKCEEYLNGWKRAQADYQNLVKEFDGRRNDYVRFANVNLIIELLPILDNFKAAFSQIPEAEKNSPWVIGFSYIKKQLEDMLAREGVEQIKTVGEEFNHEEHEAVEDDVGGNAPFDATQGDIDKDDDGNSDGVKKQVVTKEVRPGYTLNNKIVQVAKVVVARR
ncbi:MAG: nucleotide exchange factor GrpE [Patescibacteria group bacterium]